MIRFDQPDAGRAGDAADDGSIISRREIRQDRGLQIVRGREPGGGDQDPRQVAAA